MNCLSFSECPKALGQELGRLVAGQPLCRADGGDGREEEQWQSHEKDPPEKNGDFNSI